MSEFVAVELTAPAVLLDELERLQGENLYLRRQLQELEAQAHQARAELEADLVYQRGVAREAMAGMRAVLRAGEPARAAKRAKALGGRCRGRR